MADGFLLDAWDVCLKGCSVAYFWLVFGTNRRQPAKETHKKKREIKRKMTAKLHYGPAVASDGHVRRSSSGGDLNSKWRCMKLHFWRWRIY